MHSAALFPLDIFGFQIAKMIAIIIFQTRSAVSVENEKFRTGGPLTTDLTLISTGHFWFSDRKKDRD
jgi:hypothetical protein